MLMLLSMRNSEAGPRNRRNSDATAVQIDAALLAAAPAFEAAEGMSDEGLGPVAPQSTPLPGFNSMPNRKPEGKTRASAL